MDPKYYNKRINAKYTNMSILLSSAAGEYLLPTNNDVYHIFFYIAHSSNDRDPWPILPGEALEISLQSTFPDIDSSARVTFKKIRNHAIKSNYTL